MMKLMRLLAVLAALGLSAGLLAACGGDEDDDGLSNEEYAAEIQTVLEPLGENLQSLGATISQAQETEALAEGVGEAQAELEEAAASLEEITPPEGVEQVHADLISAISGFADTLEATRDAAERDNVAELQAAAAELPGEAQEFAAELQRIQQEAIDAGVPISPEEG
jgi:hypothetical protein